MVQVMENSIAGGYWDTPERHYALTLLGALRLAAYYLRKGWNAVRVSDFEEIELVAMDNSW